jgi:hypothetical protein
VCRMPSWWKFLERYCLHLRSGTRLELTAVAHRSAIKSYVAAQGQLAPGSPLVGECLASG